VLQAARFRKLDPVAGCGKPFDLVAEGLDIMDGGADGGVYSNFLGRLWDRLGGLSPIPDNDLLDLAA
jgi:hypothetical protein